MRMPRTLALPLAALAVVAAGLTVGATLPTEGVGAPTPSQSAPDATEAAAWELYESTGSREIRVDPTRPYRVDFMSATHEYPSHAGPDDAVVPGKDGRWFWFAVTYTDAV